MAEENRTVRLDRSRSPPLACHARGDNKAWSNIAFKIYVTTPTYVSVNNYNLGSISFENRSIAGPAGSGGPAAGLAGPDAGAGPVAPALPAPPASPDDDPAPPAAVPPDGPGAAPPAVGPDGLAEPGAEQGGPADDPAEADRRGQ